MSVRTNFPIFLETEILLDLILVIFPEGLNFSTTFRSEAEEKFKVEDLSY